MTENPNKKKKTDEKLVKQISEIGLSIYQQEILCLQAVRINDFTEDSNPALLKRADFHD